MVSANGGLNQQRVAVSIEAALFYILLTTQEKRKISSIFKETHLCNLFVAKVTSDFDFYIIDTIF